MENINNRNGTIDNQHIFDFIENPRKKELLIQANELLNMNKSKNEKLVFIYSAPKVGSTSIVSSLRIFGLDKMDIIHVHDEEMLKILAHINEITVNELILFNKYLGKDVYVINIYRSPIERKISTFFEKIGSYHFNNLDKNVNTYTIDKVINRFNDIFPYIGLGDHFLDKYNISVPQQFDFNNKYLLVKENNINYLSLRLQDSSIWGPILTNIFGFRICIVKDYESSHKDIKDLYALFKLHYKIPKNLLDNEMNTKYVDYYFSNDEKQKYYNEWLIKSLPPRNSYTLDQYKLYEEITLSNSYYDKVQTNHYIDEGCICKACKFKRSELASKIMRGIPVVDRITHIEAKNELINKRINKINKINKGLNKDVRISGKSFKQDMTNIVTGRRV